MCGGPWQSYSNNTFLSCTSDICMMMISASNATLLHYPPSFNVQVNTIQVCKLGTS